MVAPALVFSTLAGVALSSACQSAGSPPVTKGNPVLGEQAMQRYGCGACHTIPGVRGADAQVGPPLTNFSKRMFIAGQLANTEDNLAWFIADPQGVEPGTAMPDLGVSAFEAQNMAAYLETLE